MPRINYKFLSKFSLLFIFLAAVILRILSYTKYLTYVDSYKYLLNSESLFSSVSKVYAETYSTTVGKFGFSVFISFFNIPFQFENSNLATFARILNIILSLGIGVLLWKYSRITKFLSLFFFLSPLYFGYSSYIISEYLALFLILASVILIQNLEIKQNFKIISLGVILGYLPFIRLEMFVIVFCLGIYLFLKSNKLALKTTFLSILTYFSLNLFVALYLNKDLNFISDLFKLVNFKYYILGFIGVLLSYLFIKLSEKRFILLPYFLIFIFIIFLIISPFISFTYKNSFYTDQVLYIFSIFSLFCIFYYGIKKRIKMPLFSQILLLSLIGISIVYFNFDKNIDRYALIIFGILIIFIQSFINNLNLVFRSEKAKFFSYSFISVIFIVMGTVSIVLYPALGKDYQQNLINEFHGLNINSNEVYMSEYISLSYLFFEDKMPRIADFSEVNKFKSGDIVIIDSSLKITNSVLCSNIYNEINKFVILDKIESNLYFRMSDKMFLDREILVLQYK